MGKWVLPDLIFGMLWVILLHWIDDLCRKLMSLKLCIFCCVFNVCLLLLLLLLLLYMLMQIQFLKWWSFWGLCSKMHDDFFRREWHDAAVSPKDVMIVGEWTCLRVLENELNWSSTLMIQLGCLKVCMYLMKIESLIIFLVFLTKFLTRVLYYKKNGRLGVDSHPPKNPRNQSCTY
jgi:hypothetical protein